MALTLLELDYESLREKAHALAAAGAPAHIHTTVPGCLITGSHRRAIVLEATAEGLAFACFDDGPVEERAKPLAILLHGADSVPAEDEDLDPASLIVEAMAARMREGKGHFHILSPSCLVNPNPGRWTVLFEDVEFGVSASVTDERPLSDIRLVERLIYSRA